MRARRVNEFLIQLSDEELLTELGAVIGLHEPSEGELWHWVTWDRCSARHLHGRGSGCFGRA